MTGSTGSPVDRVFGLDFGVDGVVDPLIAWPRVLFLVAGFTLASWEYYRFEKSHDRLIALQHAEGLGGNGGGHRLIGTDLGPVEDDWKKLTLPFPG